MGALRPRPARGDACAPRAFKTRSHFTKEFKKMTGYSPRKFTDEVSNEFGRRLSLK